jgi:hypothetical protein
MRARGAWSALLAALLTLTLIGPAAAARPGGPPGTSADAPGRSSDASGRATTHTPAGRRHLLGEYAADTWRSFEALVVDETGLPADNVTVDGVRSTFTSPTNIGAYLWSTLAARDLRLISRSEAHQRIAVTIDSVTQLDRHEESGQFYNWYDPFTGELVEIWPEDGNPVYHFLSSVDNGWLSAALLMVSNTVPELRHEARALHESMDFGFYYDPDVGQLRGGYWTVLPPNQVYAPQVSGGCVHSPSDGDTGEGFTCHHYGALNTEPRIASYLGIAAGDIPAEHYFRTWRTFPDDCGWSWQEMRPVGEWESYLGVDVFQGTYLYRGMRIVPSWGGSMFEALMVNLLVPEADWGPDSWGVNHPLYVQAHIEHGLEEAGYGYWGFSPSNIPEGGYSEYGVEAIGLNPDGYASNSDRTNVDYGFDAEGCVREPQPLPTEWPNGVVTPHASFLALEFAPQQALDNLENLRADVDGIYTDWGFRDSVNVDTGVISEHYLALDQGMVMAAIANATHGERFRGYFTRGEIEDAIRPLLEMETFTAGPAS